MLRKAFAIVSIKDKRDSQEGAPLPGVEPDGHGCGSVSFGTEGAAEVLLPACSETVGGYGCEGTSSGIPITRPVRQNPVEVLLTP